MWQYWKYETSTEKKSHIAPYWWTPVSTDWTMSTLAPRHQQPPSWLNSDNSHLNHIMQYVYCITAITAIMMTSWNGNVFHITGPLWGESTCHLSYFYVLHPDKLLNKQLSCWWFEMPWCPYDAGLILGMRQANERRRYKVTPLLIGWTQT